MEMRRKRGERKNTAHPSPMAATSILYYVEAAPLFTGQRPMLAANTHHPSQLRINSDINEAHKQGHEETQTNLCRVSYYY